MVRLGKLYKMMRLVRMVRAFKLLKNQAFLDQLTESLRISQGAERLITFSFFMALYVHISACMFLIIANLTSESMPSWLKNVDKDYA